MSHLYASFISIGVAIQIKADIFIPFKSYITFAAQLRNFVVGLTKLRAKIISYE